MEKRLFKRLAKSMQQHGEIASGQAAPSREVHVDTPSAKVGDGTGLPDWRTGAGYPDPDKTSLALWAWEFLRRNPRYRADYVAYVQAKAGDFAPLRERLKVDLLPDEWSAALARKWGLPIGEPPDPSQPWQGRLEPWWPSSPDVKVIVNDTKRRNRTLNPALEFDISFPIEPQLESARKILLDAQQSLRRKGSLYKRPERARTEQFVDCLRILDAFRALEVPTDREVEAGILRKIGEVLFPRQTSVESKMRSKAARALELQAFEYRYLPALALEGSLRKKK
jgi:hypothetical protein